MDKPIRYEASEKKNATIAIMDDGERFVVKVGKRSVSVTAENKSLYTDIGGRRVLFGYNIAAITIDAVENGLFS